MKTITILILALFTLHGISLFAAFTDLKSSPNPIKTTVTEASYLSPVTPAVATFDNESTAAAERVDALSLAPITPTEATFEENAGAGSFPSARDLAPVAPPEADSDDPQNPLIEIPVPEPSIPSEATFEELV